MLLNMPATPEIRNEAAGLAADSLKTSIHSWLRKNGLPAPDKTNPVKRHFFSLFAKTCIQKARQDSYFEGRTWMLNFDISSEDVMKLIASHDAWCDSNMNAAWTRTQQAIIDNEPAATYSFCMQTIFYSMGKFNLQQEQPAIETQARNAIQTFLKTLTISCSQPILSGKPGHPIESDVVFGVKTGETPFPGLVFTARLADGTKVASIITDADGNASLTDFRMPFVSYGAFLVVRPNFGAAISNSYNFDAADFGIRLNDGQEQSLIFNVKKPAYSLSYQILSSNQSDVSSDFANDSWLRKFLEDSCYMKPVSGEKMPDLSISLKCQVTSYTYDQKEETELKVEAMAAIQQSGGAQVNKTEVINKCTYDSNHPIPSGQFFWQTTMNMRAMLRRMLMEL
jgi:hypothetical protein